MDNVKRTMLVGFLALVVTLTAQPSTAQQQPQQLPVMDISGMWNHGNLMTEDRAVLINAVGGGAKIGDYTGFPLNEAGRQWTSTPGWKHASSCRSISAIRIPRRTSLWGPGNFRLTNVFDPLTERIIGINLRGHVRPRRPDDLG